MCQEDLKVSLRLNTFLVEIVISSKPLLKCFCGCGDLTEDEVKRIYRLSTQETLINPQASRLLRKHMELNRRGDKSVAEQMLDVYEKSEEYMRDFRLLTEDELEELAELGLTYSMEKELLANIQTGEKSNIERCIRRIQGECRNEIEASPEYTLYKEAILKKLKSIDVSRRKY
ncbi:uncharacterized protein LOC129941141 isoform X2 [Eupeodes corollae]|uniref:uncharacterized protein LOC129941141 isoform X2 n=1 Tax=Eupeodes corollae TaxID=290404 RepID=UPI002492AA42|nr:uncharacterized protein LOC129941141 isoform X2 [Eupeodes corollae]